MHRARRENGFHQAKPGPVPLENASPNNRSSDLKMHPTATRCPKIPSPALPPRRRPDSRAKAAYRDGCPSRSNRAQYPHGRRGSEPGSTDGEKPQKPRPPAAYKSCQPGRSDRRLNPGLSLLQSGQNRIAGAAAVQEQVVLRQPLLVQIPIENAGQFDRIVSHDSAAVHTAIAL